MTLIAVASRPCPASAQAAPRPARARRRRSAGSAVGPVRGPTPGSTASSSAWGSTAGSSALAAVAPSVPRPLREPPGRRSGRPVAAATDVPSRVPSSAIRLTRRGRLLATLTGTALVLLCLTLVPAVASGVASAFTGATVQTTTVTVQPGQTLWQVAATTDPGGDTASVVARIADANGLTSAADVRPGQRLVVPLE